ncbi:MAG TPA: NAD(P)-binding domain-containing protein [Gammaproteobacteria bacterium]
MENRYQYPVAVLGAGPVGLAAAAQLLERGLDVWVFEAAAQVGASFTDVAHISLFSPWRYNIDKAARRLLEAEGWDAPNNDALPTAGELVNRYLLPLANTHALAPHIKLNSEVLNVARRGYDKVKSVGRERAPFVIRVREDGVTHEYLASAVIDATGTWRQPNPLGANGLAAIGEELYQDQISYGMPDILGRERARFAGRNVLVVGAGHSAAGSLIALSELAASDREMQIHWAVRGENALRVFGGGLEDGLPARGALGLKIRTLIETGQLHFHTHFRIHALLKAGEALTVVPEPGFGAHLPLQNVEQIICSTGSRPDLSLTRELRTRLDPWLEASEALAPLIDPNLHSCGTVRPHGHRELSHPEQDFYIVGAKSYGRAPTFLMATGYEQVRSIAAALVGDLAAADDVQLELPETGVCSADLSGASAAGGACCGPVVKAEPTTTQGCCGAPKVSVTRSCCG